VSAVPEIVPEKKDGTLKESIVNVVSFTGILGRWVVLRTIKYAILLVPVGNVAFEKE
jgi:hypothetical protein